MADKKKAPGAGRQASVNDPDPLGLLPRSLRPDSTRERDQAAQQAHEGVPEVEHGADDLDKTIDQGWSEDDEDYLTMKNPMSECVERRKKELGADAEKFSFKFFAPGVAGVIGTEDYRKCLDRQGNEYKVGEMWMGEIPKRIAEKRRMAALKESEEAVSESEGRFSEQVERLKADAKGLGLRVVASGDEINPNAGSDERKYGQARPGGLTVTRF